MNYIASNLKFLRKLTGLSQEVFAHKVDMNRGNIASYEKGSAEPSIEKLQRIADFFELDLVSFIQTDLSSRLNIGQIQSSENNDKEDTEQKSYSINELLNDIPLQTVSEAANLDSEMIHKAANLRQHEFLVRQNFYQDIHKMALHLAKISDLLEKMVGPEKGNKDKKE